MLQERLAKATKKALDAATNENKHLREQLKKQIEDSIMTINQIQDVQAINVSEAEKDMMRNSIINVKRTEYVTKIIELDRPRKSSNS